MKKQCTLKLYYELSKILILVPLIGAFLLTSSLARAQNPALPPDSCIIDVPVFTHFEYDSLALRLYYRDQGVETVRLYSSTGAFLHIDTIHVDSAITYKIQNDSVLVGEIQGTVLSQETLPSSFWKNKYFTQVGIPISGAYHVARQGAFFYFLWIQQPVSSTWNGSVWVTKTNEQFEQVGNALELGEFISFAGLEYFGLLADELIGISYHTIGSQSSYSHLAIATLDLAPQKTFINSGTGSAPPGTGLRPLPNKRFSYYEGLVVPLAMVQNAEHYGVVAAWKNNLIVPISERYFKHHTEAGVQTKHILTTSLSAHADEGYITHGNSVKTLYVNPLYIVPDPAAGNYYAVDSLHCETTLANADTALFTRFSFLTCLGVLAMQTNFFALFEDGSLVDLRCASEANSPSSTIGVMPNPPVVLYPNPVQNLLYVNYAPSPAMFRLKDALGRTCLQIESQSPQVEFPLHSFKAGLYFMEIEDLKTHRVQVRKVCKVN